MLFELLGRIPQGRIRPGGGRDIVPTTARHTPLHANVDLALAVFTASCGMPATAGETIFAVARTAGWIVHALEEYGERPRGCAPVVTTPARGRPDHCRSRTRAARQATLDQVRLGSPS
ncbi:citrate synthase [Streptomyces sp. DI166]|nr:citrate synthase [Streptomyces sp. DI166]